MGISEKTQVYFLFTVTVVAAALGGLSQTALNVMMNVVCDEYGLGLDLGQWMTTLYILVLGIAVPSTTFLDRKLTDRGFLLLALVICLVGTFISAIATTFACMLVGRVLQAIASGILIPSSQNIAMRRFPRASQGAAMGVSGIAMGFAPNIGPTVGSWFVAGPGWRWFFIMLAVSMLVMIALTLVFLSRENRPRQSIRFDFGSFALCAIAFGALLAGLSNASSFGILHYLVWLPVIAGSVMLWFFVRRENRLEDPLINLHIFDSHVFRAGLVGQGLLFASFMNITLAIPQFIADMCGGTPADAGMVLLPAAIGALIFNPLGGVLSDKFGQVRVLRWTTAVLVIGSTPFVFFDGSVPMWLLATCQCVRGAGISASIGPFVTWSLSRLSHGLIAHGSSFSTLVRQACASLGTTVVVFCIEALPMLGVGMAMSFHVAFGVSAALAIATMLVVWVKARGVDVNEPLADVVPAESIRD